MFIFVLKYHVKSSFWCHPEMSYSPAVVALIALFVLVTIGITKEEYAQRRSRFIDLIGSEAVAIFPAAEHHKMTNDIPYSFFLHCQCRSFVLTYIVDIAIAQIPISSI